MTLILNNSPMLFFVCYLLAFIVAVQFFYYAVLFLRLAWYKPKPIPVDKDLKGVSVVIPIVVYNEDKVIALVEKIKHTTSYTKEHIELVLVLCVDTNLQGIRFDKIHGIYHNVKIVQLHQESKYILGDKYPISIGIKSASYDTILLTKENCLPESDEWIKSMLESKAAHTDIVLGYFNYKEEKGLFNKFMRFENIIYFIQSFAFARLRVPITGSSKNMLLSRKAFYENKGFAHFSDFIEGEDNLLITQIARKNNVSFNIAKESFVNYTSSFSYYQWAFKKSSYLSTIKFYDFPRQMLIFLFVLSHCLFYAVSIGVMIQYICHSSITDLDAAFLYLILFRFLFVYLSLSLLVKRFCQANLIKWIPVMDLLMLFYYVLFGLKYFKNPKKKY